MPLADRIESRYMARRIMTSPLHIVYFITLGCFWGLSPSLYKLMGEAALPITHIIVYTGIGVGAALGVIAWLRNGSLPVTREILWYGFGCAALLNLPFAMSLFFARHVAATEYALIISTAPFWNYLVAMLTGRESATRRRLAAIIVGFVSSTILLLSRGSILTDGISIWIIASFSVPIIYVAYNWFAARCWPKDAEIMTVGAVESLWSGLLAIPFFLLIEPPWSVGALELSAYTAALIATVMWIAERIAYFSLIRDKGAVYTIQAVYVSTPAAVIWAIAIFGGGTDLWLWVSLGVLMVALWLNNSRPQSATQPSA